MKIAIASTGNTMTAHIDKHFARCTFFAIYDSSSGDVDFIKNICQTNQVNAGTSAVSFINNFEVEKIISGDFGQKVKSGLEKCNIQMIIMPDDEKTIGEIIELFKSNHAHTL
jgi:predicted Fe-Mo cluster-binding NifX family protein